MKQFLQWCGVTFFGLIFVSTPVGCQYATHCGPDWLQEPIVRNGPEGAVPMITALLLMVFAVICAAAIADEAIKDRNK